MYVSKVIVMPIIMQTRLSKPETIKFRSDLGFNQIDLILKKRTIIINTAIKRIFCRKNRASTQSLKNERVWTDIYFFEHKLVVEIDEKGHTDRNQNEENERQIKKKKRLNCKFYWINPDVEGCDVYITQSNEKKLKRIIIKLHIKHF